MADERAKEAREAAAEPEESAPSGGPRGEGDTPQTPTGPAAADTRRPTRRGRVRRWVRRLALLALTCTLLAGALYLGREFTLHPLAARLAPVLTPLFSDYEVEVRRIRGDWFTELRFEGLQVRSEVAGTGVGRAAAGIDTRAQRVPSPVLGKGSGAARPGGR